MDWAWGKVGRQILARILAMCPILLHEYIYLYSIVFHPQNQSQEFNFTCPLKYKWHSNFSLPSYTVCSLLKQPLCTQHRFAYGKQAKNERFWVLQIKQL